MTKIKKPSFGSVSSGTMKAEDLIPAFLSELEYYAPKSAKAFRIDHDIEAEDFYESEDTEWALETLFDALNVVASRVPYMYFGAHPGDGADYGFWLSESFEDDALKWCNDTRRPNMTELNDYFYYYTMNDHGNITLFARNHREMWSLV